MNFYERAVFLDHRNAHDLVLAMVLFVDGSEGNRIRFSTEPLLIVLKFLVWPAPLRALPWRRAGASVRRSVADG